MRGRGKDTFYDRIIPRYFNKIGRKFGAQVGNVTIGTEKGKNGLTPWNRVKAEVPSIPITDSMRESVMHEGQPLFHKQGNIEHGSSDTDTGNGADSSREETDAGTAGALGQAPQGVRRRLAGRTPSYARSMVSGNETPNKITAADGIGAFDPRSADILKQRRVAPTF